ncbi:MAG TPA: ROK family protein [Candidatus Paceibacterota bacterium]|nr:ROK family protein [Candidatus Paceibacterota bacterium]
MRQISVAYWLWIISMYIVADIGGTKMRLAAAREVDHFETPIFLGTPQSYDEALALFVETAKLIAGQDPITAIAIGLPAVLTSDKRSISKSEHLPEWGGHALTDDLERALGTKIYLENDTALVGLGEATFGAGKGSSIVAYVTVSTGVNGIRIVDGAIDRAALGFEIGGQYLSATEPLITLENLISGSAIQKRYGMHPRDIGKETPLWEELARVTAVGVHNTILHWSPDTVVLGGSMFNDIGIPVESVARHLSEIMKKFPQIPEIFHSSLYDEGGLYGGLARLATTKH